jgi:Rieske Fe-S protein
MRDSPQTPAQANSSTPSTDLKRRRFLLAVSAGGAGAAAAAVPARAVVSATADPAATAATGYRESEHVKRYYDTTRL